MADILIRGMNIPRNCLDCKIRGDRLTCPILDRYAMNNKTDRRPDCPIFPFPEGHGRCIDADALMPDFVKARWAFFSDGDTFLQLLKHAPTIIPAEGWMNDDD